MNNGEPPKHNPESPENLLRELEMQRQLAAAQRAAHPRRNGRAIAVIILVFLACAGAIALYVAATMLENAARPSSTPQAEQR